jgi:membrane protease YdiL (CAAX protease family)
MHADEHLAAQRRRRAVLAAPVLVPVSMAATFTVLRRLFGPRWGYNAGFAVYWAGWCAAFPMWVMGGKRVLRMLSAGAAPSVIDTAWLIVPVGGAVSTELLPNRRAVTPSVGMTMAATAIINAVGEELLWRGVFLDAFPDDVWRGAVWPCAGFTLWHLSPQLVLPSHRGRMQFLAGAALVGGATARVAWRTRGLRWTLAPHILIDACGVRVALFRLGQRTAGNAGG